MRRLAFKPTIVTLLVASTVTSLAQQKQPLSKSALAAKLRIESLRPQAHITVIRKGASEEFGDFISHDGESFTFFDVDQKRNIKLKYSEVNKVKNGYGGYNPIRGKHTDQTKRLIVVLVVVGVLGAVIGAAVAAK